MFIRKRPASPDWHDLRSARRTRVDDGIQEFVPAPPQTVDTGMSAPDVAREDIPSLDALRARSNMATAVARPRFLRGFVWYDRDTPTPTFSSVSFTHQPMPRVPRATLADPIVNATLQTRPDLFDIVTPIHVPRLAHLLTHHPNRPFVDSVLDGLSNGFWSFADARPEDYPDTWDEVRPPVHDAQAIAFLRQQRDDELAQRRYSPAFGPDLLPGMYAMPVHVIPKPHSDKFRLINNLSAGPFSPNSMVRPESVKGAVLDGIPSFAAALRCFRRQHPDVELVIWKSDVSQAYRRMPMSKYWQIRQIVTIDGMRHVDRCNLFGGRGSLRIWSSFASLVAWIAVEIDGIVVWVYVDDFWGFAIKGDVRWYAPYAAFFPTPQVILLQLFDRLGISHERPKQLAGSPIPVIGFDINPNSMTATLPMEARTKLLEAIRAFSDLSPGHRRRSLAEFRSFTGYVNWAFNVFPLLKPALSRLYEKMRDKTNRFAGIYVNSAMARDLAWLARRVETSRGICFLDANAWSPADLSPTTLSDEFATVDASGKGIGLYFPWRQLAYYSGRPVEAPVEWIYFFEALAVCSAIHRIPVWRLAGRRISRLAVLSDNTNTVSMFNTLRADPVYNSILMSSIDVQLDHDLSLCVDHIPGRFNEVADALSRFDFDRVRRLAPGVSILPFTPPRDALGAVTT